MAIRFESSGVHLYDRRSGVHVLLDEVEIRSKDVSPGPRTLSIAITDSCDFCCRHCHVRKGSTFLDAEFILHVCRVCESLGTLDVALGGGEPTLHPDFARICKRLWAETGLGVSFTTHGHHLTEALVDEVRGALSFVRVSIDGTEPSYSLLRGRPLRDLVERVRLLGGAIPFGINTVVSSDTLAQLDDLLALSLDLGACELLLLPIVIHGVPQLAESQWNHLSQWISANKERIALRVGAYARPYLNAPFLFDDPQWEQDYAHLATDGTLRTSSYAERGLELAACASVKDCVLAWRRGMTEGWDLSAQTQG